MQGIVVVDAHYSVTGGLPPRVLRIVRTVLYTPTYLRYLLNAACAASPRRILMYLSIYLLTYLINTDPHTTTPNATVQPEPPLLLNTRDLYPLSQERYVSSGAQRQDQRGTWGRVERIGTLL